jgi:hypothetical protein
MKKISELLSTKNAHEQAERIQTLMNMASAPVIDLIVRADMRTGSISLHLVGPDLPAVDIHRILDAAKEYLRKQELEAMQPKEGLKVEEEG